MVPMRWNLWLAQPDTERSLRTTLRITIAVVALWALAAAYGVWSNRAALAAAKASSESQGKKIAQINEGLPEKRRQAQKADAVKVVSSQGAGSAEITMELADLARRAGAQVRGVRIGDGGQTAPAVKAAPAEAGTAAAPNAQTPAPKVSDAGTQESFECNVSGEYPALTGFLRGLAASHHALDITSIQVMQGDMKARTASPRLEMKLNGTIDETSEKS